ncbi:MAG: PAS domain S-box protein, partial [Thermoleophilia bacterium]|nr:PAS domain S-box protein [Thermoleophilia bacterium]
MRRALHGLPDGSTLPENLWRRRHTALLTLLWLHAPALALFGLTRGVGVRHGLVEGGIVAFVAVAATAAGRYSTNRHLLATIVALGLLTSSATIVHLSDGAIEAHFHFFVMMSVLLLYEDWLPYAAAFGYVVLHHGTVGVFNAGSVYNHQAALDHPWRWAAIHGSFITAAGIANIVNWRLNETARLEARAASNRADLSDVRFAAAFDNAPIGVALVAPDGRWLNMNRALIAIMGYSREELLAMDFQRITHPDDLEGDLDQVRRVLAGEIDTYELEKRYIHASGRVIRAQLNVSLVRDSAGGPLYFISQIQDITNRRQLEEQFRQSQKMDAVGRLAGGVAHDFNNLLTVIAGYSELALHRVTDGDLSAERDDVRDELEEIKNATGRAASLTQQLLAFSRQQVVRPDRLDVNEIAGTIEKMLDRLIGEDVSLTVMLDPAAGTVLADAGQLEQVILNLAINARDAMPDGGTLTIATAAVELEHALDGEHGRVEPGRYVLLTVADDGTGMDAETQARMFEPVFTTKEPGQGPGLGLSTVYGILEQSGG